MKNNAIKPGLPLFISLICLICPNSIFAQEKPSAKMLIDSWSKMCAVLQHDIHSYRLIGSFEKDQLIPKTNTSVQNSILTIKARWTILIDGNNFHYEYHQDMPKQKYSEISYDGKQWYILHQHENRLSGIICNQPSSLFKLSPLTEYKNSYLWPEIPADLLCDPTETHSKSPIPIQYYKALKYIKVTGPEIVLGKPCYHLHIPLKYASYIPAGAPTDIWMRIFNKNFAPWQFQVYYNAKNRKTISCGLPFGGQWYHSAFIPSSFSIINEVRKNGAAWIPVSIEVIGATVAYINGPGHFEVNNFRIAFPPGTQVYIQDGTSSRYAKVYQTPDNSIRRSNYLWKVLLAHRALVILALLIMMGIIRYVLMRRNNQVTNK